MSDIISRTIEFVQGEMQGQDGSHDWYHIERVMNMAITIANKEGITDLEVVKLGALLHDIADWKYSGSETAGPAAARSWLVSQNYDPIKIEKIISIIEGVGFKNELGLTPEESAKRASELPELAVVQDADRLDAIGAIGIARAFTYGGKKSRPLHVPGTEKGRELTKEVYMADPDKKNGATVQHFHEKLLKLKGLMKTATGKAIAEERHKYMEEFLERFSLEWEGTM